MLIWYLENFVPKFVRINFLGGCVKCPFRALIEGQPSAWASWAKTEKCPLWQFFLNFSQNFVYYFALDGLSDYLSSLIWKFYYKKYKKYSLHFEFLHFSSPCSVGKLALHQRRLRPFHATPWKANFRQKVVSNSLSKRFLYLWCIFTLVSGSMKILCKPSPSSFRFLFGSPREIQDPGNKMEVELNMVTKPPFLI